MKKTLRKLDSKWGMTLAICVTIVVSSVATATAGSLINGKNIKKGTVASKQIKNGTIVKADLSKKLSVAGPQGPQGVPGAAAATNVITRRFVEAVVGTGTSADRDIQCAAGEHLVGGGAAFVKAGGDNEVDATISSSAPANSAGDPAADLSVATGWTGAGKNEAGSNRAFRVYAVCAKP